MTAVYPIVIGVTGGIACGKSEVGRFLVQEGFCVLDADQVAHEVLERVPVRDAVVKSFGTEILAMDGKINRSRLSAVVFNKSSQREELNRLVHPSIQKIIAHWVDVRRNAREEAAVLMPLLFEIGMVQGWDAIVCIAMEKMRVFQQLEKRGLAESEAKKWIAAQMPLEKKMKRSDFVIENNGSLETLHRKTLCIVNCLRKKRKNHE